MYKYNDFFKCFTLNEEGADFYDTPKEIYLSFWDRTGELLPVRQVCKPLHYGATECKILRLLHTRNADNFTILFL